MTQQPWLVRRLAGAMAMFLIAMGLVVAWPSPASAAVTRVDVTDVLAYESITASNGDVTVAGCSSTEGTFGTKTLDPSGNVIGTTPIVSTGQYDLPALSLCDFQKAVGPDGTLYGSDPTEYPIEKVAAYTPSGQLKWAVTLTGSGCSGAMFPNYFRVGSDSNLYVVGSNNWCSNSYLYSYTPTGTLRWLYKLSGQVGFMNVYSGGVVLFSSYTVKHFDFQGNLESSTAVVDGLPAIPTSNDMGMIVAVTYRWTQSGECGWSSGRSVVKSIAGYTPSGLTLYHQPNCSSLNSIVALAGGGVVFSGDGYVDGIDHITKLGHNPVTGITTSEQLMQFTDIEGQRTFGKGAGLIADTNGGFLAYRSFTREHGKYHGTQFRSFRSDGGEGSVFNTDEIDPAKSIMIVGESVSLAPGQLSFITLECGGWACSTMSPRYLNIVQMPKLGMDYPRGALLGVAPQTFDSMAVVGDSFSAGIGSLQPGQSYTDANCSRSPSAYGPRLAEAPVVKLHMPASSFLACSGAVTADVLSNQVGSIPQNAKSVFLTVGGNNVGFTRFGALCIFLDCATQGYDQEFDAQLANLPDALTDVYDAILAQAPNATVYVLGYPHIMPLQDCSDAGSGGWWLGLQAAVAANPSGFKQFLQESFGFSVAEADTAVSSIFTISNSETLAARNFTNALNLAISDTVDGIGGSRLKFVSTNQPDSPLAGHELCSQDPYFHGLSLDFGGTFHPNAAGQDAMHQVARDALAAYQPQYVVA